VDGFEREVSTCDWFFGRKRGSGVDTFAEKPGRNPAENPAAAARAGREPQNPRTPEQPPTPPAGGSSSGTLIVEQSYRSDRGRNRRRQVTIDVADVRGRLASPSATDRHDWDAAVALLRDRVGESTFAIWLEPVQLLAVDRAGVLVLAAPEQTLGWIRSRFARQLADCETGIGRELRFADPVEFAAVAGDADHGRPPSRVDVRQKEVS
jgi:hypothetical protein